MIYTSRNGSGDIRDGSGGEELIETGQSTELFAVDGILMKNPAVGRGRVDRPDVTQPQRVLVVVGDALVADQCRELLAGVAGGMSRAYFLTRPVSSKSSVSTRLRAALAIAVSPVSAEVLRRRRVATSRASSKTMNAPSTRNICSSSVAELGGEPVRDRCLVPDRDLQFADLVAGDRGGQFVEQLTLGQAGHDGVAVLMLQQRLGMA